MQDDGLAERFVERDQGRGQAFEHARALDHLVDGRRYELGGGHRTLARGSPDRRAVNEPPPVAHDGGEPRPERPIGRRRVLERGHDGVLHQVVGIGIAVDERASEHAQRIQVGGDVHVDSMPPPRKVLARSATIAKSADLTVESGLEARRSRVRAIDD